MVISHIELLKNKMKPLFFYMLICSALLLHAQKITWEHELELEKHTTFLNIPFVDKDGIYFSLGNATILQDHANDFGLAAFGKMDHSYQRIFITPFYDQGGSLFQLGTVKKGNNIVNFIQYNEVHSYRASILVDYINGEGKQYKKTMTAQSMDLDVLKCKKIRTHFKVSPDSNYVVCVSERQGDPPVMEQILGIPLNPENKRPFKSKDKFVFVNVFSKEGNLLWQKTEMLGENKEGEIVVEDCAVDNKGQVYILCKFATIDSAGMALNNVRPRQTNWYDYQIFIINTKDTLTKYESVKIPGYFIYTARLFPDNDKVVCTGFLLNIATKSIAGFFTHTTNSGQETKQDTLAWENETRKYFSVNDEFSLPLNKKDGFRIKNIHRRTDGGYYVLAEYTESYTVTHYYGGGYTLMQDNRDILLISLDEDLHINWTTVFPKKTSASLRNIEFASFYSFVTGNTLCLLYNDTQENFERTPENAQKNAPVDFSFNTPPGKKLENAATLLFLITPERVIKQYVVDKIDEENRLVSTQACILRFDKELILISSRANKPVKIGKLQMP